MTAQLGEGALAEGDRVHRLVDDTALAVAYGTATVLERKELGRTGLRFWCKIELDTGGGPDETEPCEEWIPEHQLALVRRAGERAGVSQRGSS